MMTLRETTDDDLPIFFEHQRDERAAKMAGFPSRERDAFFTHWRANVLKPQNCIRTVVVDGTAAGYVSSWEQDGMRLVAYWIGNAHWGKGLATQALTEFLAIEPVRPLHAYVVDHNVGSIRVLEKCGFRILRREESESLLVKDPES